MANRCCQTGAFLAFAWAILLAPFCTALAADGGWSSFKTDFISPDGRLVDYGQDQVSHSEGQSYALLLAEKNADRATFDQVLQWTLNNLGKRSDGLLAWKWGRDERGQWGILDQNNATDGDLVVALALARAAERWREPVYANKARAIAQALRVNLAREWQGKLLLLPGQEGFEEAGKLVINPSYILSGAYTVMASLDDADFWHRCARDGQILISQTSFGYWGLPADWVELGSEARPQTGRGEFFSHDGIRLLFIAPEKMRGALPLIDYVRQLGWLPVRIDLLRDTASLHESYAGAYATLAHAARKLGRTADAERLLASAKRHNALEQRNYYSRVLQLLADSDALH